MALTEPEELYRLRHIDLSLQEAAVNFASSRNENLERYTRSRARERRRGSRYTAEKVLPIL